MTARTYLEQHRRLTNKARRIEEAIEEARAAAEYPGVNLTGMPHNPSPRNTQEDKLIRLATLEEKLRQTIIQDQETIYDIENTINSIENEQAAEVLHLRYIKCVPFENPYGETIAAQMNYSTPHIYTLHRIGLEQVQNLLDEKSIS